MSSNETSRPPVDAFDRGYAKGFDAAERNGIDQERADIKRGMIAGSALLGMMEQEIRLGAGEITAQEMRAVKAVLEWRRQTILRKAEQL